ncbi:hypothetical protein BJ993_002144 [Nocardioides aromaticivorans]|uniref:DUF4435 domain-containing protein n=1 Tax=Nocardioides aromaticivorans TaxID=200618 RepID=A0A7Y9ZGK0_9ACTN|nr:hypothetical protein [Nocardioides aromaticivorans]NYI45064.1 hypothetical protein [Nocardioides aromaticivorans]
MYSAPERRTPSELRVLYEVQPDVRDVIVEGRVDRRLVSWYLHERGGGRARVYAVDDRIDPQSLTSPGSNPGKRDYVIALAQEVGGLEEPSITCVVDSDRDGFGANQDEGASEVLLRTDFGSMDAYAFQQRPLQQMLSVGLGRDFSASTLISDLTPLLVDLAVARRALHEVGVPVVDRFVRAISKKGGDARIEVPELIRRSLAARGESSSLDEVVGRAEYFHSLVPADPRLIIRGHDIAPLIAWHQNLSGDHARSANLESMMRTSLQASDLDDYPLFQELRRRVC